MAAAPAKAVFRLDSLAAVRTKRRARLAFLHRGADGRVEIVGVFFSSWWSGHGWRLADVANRAGGALKAGLELFQASQALVDFFAELGPSLEIFAMLTVHQLDHSVLDARE